MKTIDAATLKQKVHAAHGGAGELALLDIREHGQYGMGHPFFAVSCPYSVLEKRVVQLVPRRSAPVVVFDDGDGVAERAAERLDAIGYGDVTVLDGGAPAWAAAGYTLYQGVNLPSKTFGELVEITRHTPHISAADLKGMQDRGDNMIILDGRTPEEYANFNIPGGISCPNAELPLRFDALVSDPKTTVVINCAGRTRSIIGAQTLIDFGVPHKVVALENGTQGWALIDLDLERGADRFAPANLDAAALAAAKARSDALAAKHGLAKVDRATLAKWSADGTRTTYLIDVRSRPEFEAGHLPGAKHVPGGQLVQATDLTVGVLGARVVICDDNEVRATMAAHWLKQMGRDVFVLAGGVGPAASEKGNAKTALDADMAPKLPETAVEALRGDAGAMVLDMRSSQAFREGHVPGAKWALRPQLAAAATAFKGRPVVLVADDVHAARLAAIDIHALGGGPISVLAGGMDAWTAAGHPQEASPNDPPDEGRKDYLFFTGQRHMGNKEHMRQYLEWEIGLVGQLDADERAAFHLPEA
jgi:rhodanese-related sulfurtransferase